MIRGIEAREIIHVEPPGRTKEGIATDASDNCDIGYVDLVLGDPEATAYVYCKSRNLPNTDTQH